MTFKNTLLIFFCSIKINSKAMGSDTAQYKIVPTRQGIAYIEKSGLTIHDESDYRIKSTSGLVYILPNKEVVLLPTNFDLDYPGVVFKNLEIFKHYADLNFFPIGEDNMTWFERYNGQIKQFRSNREVYTTALETLNITLPFKNVEEIKSAFLKVQSFTDSTKSKDFSFEQIHMIYSFGLGVANYLIDYKGYKLIIEKGYENYNPITNVSVKKDGKFKDVLYTCRIYIETNSPDSLKAFCRSLDIN